MSFPFAHFLVIFSRFLVFLFLTWISFLFRNYIFDYFFMLTIKNSLLLSIELFSFLLEDLITNGLMLRDTVRIELSTTSNRALNKSWWVILNDILFGLKICLFDRFVLCLIRWVIIVAWCLLMVELLLSQWWTSLCLWPCILLSFIDNRLLLIILLIIVWWFGLLGSRLGNISRRLLLLFVVIIRVWSVVILIVVVVAIFIVASWRILVPIVIIDGQVIISTVRGVVVSVPIIIWQLLCPLVIVQRIFRPYFSVLLLLFISIIILIFVTIYRHMILCIRLKIVIVFIVISSQLWALPSIRRIRPTIIIIPIVDILLRLLLWLSGFK